MAIKLSEYSDGKEGVFVVLLSPFWISLVDLMFMMQHQYDLANAIERYHKARGGNFNFMEEYKHSNNTLRCE